MLDSLNVDWLVFVIERDRYPSLEFRERGKSGDEPGRFITVGDRVSGMYCGTPLWLSPFAERGGPEDADGQCWWLEDALLDVFDWDEQVLKRELAPARRGSPLERVDIWEDS